VIRFDPSSAQRQLREKQTALEQAQAKLDEAAAQARITEEEDKRNLAEARYNLERAELEVSKQEVVSAVQGEQARIDLGLAEKRLNVEEATQALHQASSAANIASLTRARDQAQYEVELTEHRLSQMEVKAPGSGTIVYMQNTSQGYLNRAEFKAGDQVWANTVVAEIPDLSTLEIESKVEETDRSRIDVGDEVRIQVDALPELTLYSSVRSISALTHMGYEYPATYTFRAFASLDDADPKLRPGMPATMDVIVDRFPDAITIPARALFTLEGKPVVYVSEDGGYRPVEVEILARNPDEVAISGIDEGTLVSLREPASEGDA
jgi:multidrug efflux pump subunit AcrA (membrane-fusion protein)